jgi:hypothetical protein
MTMVWWRGSFPTHFLFVMAMALGLDGADGSTSSTFSGPRVSRAVMRNAGAAPTTMTLLSAPPCLVLRGGAGSRLGQQGGKTKKTAGTEPLHDESDDVWAEVPQGSRRKEAKKFQAKARSIIEQEEGALQHVEDEGESNEDEEGGGETQGSTVEGSKVEEEEIDLSQYVAQGSLEAAFGSNYGKEGPRTESEAQEVSDPERYRDVDSAESEYDSRDTSNEDDLNAESADGAEGEEEDERNAAKGRPAQQQGSEEEQDETISTDEAVENAAVEEEDEDEDEDGEERAVRLIY